MKLLRESYRTLKYKLGRIPTILDFKKFGSVDVMKIFEKCGSYHNFLKKYETFDYPNFHLSMDCFWCEIVKGGLELKEHEVAKWLIKEKLYSVEWLPADVELIEKIKREL